MGMIFVAALLFAPLYVWRFVVFGVDLNFLFIYLSAVIAVALGVIIYRKAWREFIAKALQLPRFLLIAIIIFFAAGTLGLFIGGFDIPKFGQWSVLFAQPIALFFLIRYFATKDVSIKQNLKDSVLFLVGLAGILALVQYFTLTTLPEGWWGNAMEPKRAIAFFAHPNAYALFVTPLLAWLIPGVWDKFKKISFDKFSIELGYVLFWLVGVAGMFVSLSRGAWLGFAVACVIYALWSRNKKIIAGMVIAFILLTGVIAVVPNLRYRVILPFQGEKSTVARFSLWETGLKAVAEKPLLGQGVNGFNYNWERLNTDPNLEHYNYPHNIFLNFWTDYGLMGMFSFAAILLWIMWQGLFKNRSHYKFAMALFVVAMITHGMIDIPYLKNDLGLAFWMMLALSE